MYDRGFVCLSQVELRICYLNFFKLQYILRTSAASPTNFGPKLIFASCVVGTCNIIYVGEFSIGRGSYFLSTTDIMLSVGIFALAGNFELDLTSYLYLFYKCTTAVVSTMLYCSVICMVGGLVCFFSPLLF